MSLEDLRKFLGALGSAFEMAARAIGDWFRACFGAEIRQIGPREFAHMKKYIRGAYRTKRAERKALRRIGRLLRAGV